MKNRISSIVKILFTTVFILVLGNLSASEKWKIVDQRFSSIETTIPTYIKFDEKNAPSLIDLKGLFSTYWKSDDAFDFVLTGVEKDKLNQTHYRFNQTYNGISIEFAELIVHTQNEKILSVNGKIADKAPKNDGEQIQESEALQFALNYIGAKNYKWQSSEEEAHLKIETNNPEATYFPDGELVFVGNSTSINSLQLKLAFRFNIYAETPLSRREIYISASDGSVLYQNNLIHTANVKGTATTVYSGNQTINTDSTASNSFRLRQTVSGGGVNTYDLRKGTSYASAFDFTDSNNIWNNVNANLDEYATDAHWGAEQTHLYFDSLFGRNSINDNGFVLNSYIHYSTNYVNAFWDGQRMTYGDGNANVTPLVALDIAGHEIAHGLTNFSANLVYEAESGALNESFSDIFGTAVEFFGRSATANWTIGEDIGITLRSMASPNLYGDPDTYGGRNWKTVIGCTPTVQNNYCGVHSNSGVQNFWFYLLANGGTGTNDNNDVYDVTALGIDTAAAIAYRNLTTYLVRSSDYADARFYSIRSAIDLYGACSKEVEAVTNAWHAVGVGSKYIPGIQSGFSSADTTQCKVPFEVSFTNESNNGLSYFWDFGDGDTSSLENPTHTYLSEGKFDVKLVVDGGACGEDSTEFIDFIDIDSSNACIAILGNGNNPNLIDCSGKLFDSGGSGGNYKNNESAVVTISPPNAATLTLDFKSFDIETGNNNSCNFDFLEIFDGPSVNSPSLGVFCNSTGSPGVITSKFGSVTIRFTSDAGLNRSGFEMDWSCNYPTAPPVTDFLISSDTTCTGSINFQDFSTNAPSSWSWDFGDGTFSSEKNPNHTYISNGTYDVKLLSTNSFGSDSITKLNAVFVDRPAKATTTNDTICANQTASLTASGQGTLNWYDREIGGVSLHTGTTFNPTGIIKDTSFWVEDLIQAPIETLGPSSNAIGTGGNFSGDQHLNFDVFEEIELISVRVYSGSSANRTIELRDSNGVVLQSFTRFVPSGVLRINLNFNIKPGKNYQLGVSTSSGGPDLYRNNGGVSYPYNLSGKLSIKSSSATTNPTGFYYFFYNWRVRGTECSGIRAESAVQIDTTCSPTSIAESTNIFQDMTLYPNPAKDRVSLSNPFGIDFQQIEVIDLQGRNTQINVLFQENKLIFDISGLSNGVYFIKGATTEASFVKKFIVNR